MQSSWIGHESILLQVACTLPLFAREDVKKEFREFVARLKTRLQKERSGANESTTFSADAPTNSNGVPIGHYDKRYGVNVELDCNLANKFQLQRLPHETIAGFEYVIAQYFKFRNIRRFKKMRQLRQSQALLPIANVKDEILGMLDEHQVLIIAGDTGCGKSTQLPSYLLSAAPSSACRIACTQPRRLACTALARRVAFETLKQYSSEVAFQTRFDKTKTGSTRLLFLTEGLLLRQLGTDADLSTYGVIILDEVHERNISGDLLVSLLRDIVRRRPDLKLILMSATINIDLFKSFFPEAPIIKIPGRLYPIELHYMPPKVRDAELGKRAAKIDTAPYVNILQQIDSKYPTTERGDVLVFLNGVSEISILADTLKEYAEFTKKWIVLILCSTLSVEEQNKVFDVAPAGVRKCILSTNIAETSVTIDGVRFVVDSGKENLMRFDATTGTHRLTQTWISKASADQRKGRAGRTGPGVCYRLYSPEEFEKMENFTLPEIKRIALNSLIMQILDMGLEVDVRHFPFLERPDIKTLNDTLDSLKSQGVVDARNERKLTPLGAILAKLPVEVPVGKMLISACVLDQLDVALTVAAGLSVQSPFTNRSYRDHECMQSRQHLISDMGDPFTLIRIYREWLKLRRDGDDTRKWARKCGIEEARLYEVVKLRRQLRGILEQSQLVTSTLASEFGALTSGERRVKLGEKRKLNELKKHAQYTQRKSKMLKEGHHFDTIMDEKPEDNDTDNINSLEFSLLTDDRQLSRELITHRLNDATACLLQMIISFGCYPQYAVVDTGNNFRVGHDLFTHTISRPFTVVHPNSALGQLPEALQTDAKADGASTKHQFVFYGMLLETTKSYLCNGSRVPALFLLLSAKNITRKAANVLCCDGFIDITFAGGETDCTSVLNTAVEIRQQFNQFVENKLSNYNFGDSRHLQKRIINFAKLQVPIGLRKIINPPKAMDYGVFLPNGEEYSLADEDFTIFHNNDEESTSDKQLDEELDAKKPDERKKGGREYFCEECKQTLWFESNVEVIRHKRGHDVKTPK